MGYFLRSIQDEYDDRGNYIGNSDGGNKFHGVEKSSSQGVISCARCGSTIRREHGAGGSSVCANCDCSESKKGYR